ncbi:VOC family protein [Chloroflexota bacterium]
MKVEKLDRVAIWVEDIDKAIELYSSLLGITFDKMPEHAPSSRKDIKAIRMAVSPAGLELLQTVPPLQTEGVRSVVFKVADIEQAKAEMKEKGFPLLVDVKRGGLKEAIFGSVLGSDNARGARLVLVEYEAPTVAEAMRQE